MGCYGIGVGRMLAAAIEQNHDENGIIWPCQLAPYQVHLVALSATDAAVRRGGGEARRRTGRRGVDVLFDDREERPGVKFKDADLLGMPLRVVIGGKTLARGVGELRVRRSGEKSSRRRCALLAGTVAEMIGKLAGRPAGALTAAVSRTRGTPGRTLR